MIGTMADGQTSGDQTRPERKVERVREWEHLGKPDCPRRDRPVYTPPDQLPGPCGATKKGHDWYGCGSENWSSKGIVLRDQDKRVVHREKASA